MGVLWGDGGHWTTTTQATETNSFVQRLPEEPTNSHAFNQELTSRYSEENTNHTHDQLDNVNFSHHSYAVADDFVTAPTTFMLQLMQQSSNMVYFSPLHMHANNIEEPTQFVSDNIQNHTFNTMLLNTERGLSNTDVIETGTNPTNLAPLPSDVMKPGLEQFAIAVVQPMSITPTKEVGCIASSKVTAERRTRISRRRVRRPRTIHARLYTCGITGCGKTFTLERDLARHQVYSLAHEEFRSSERWVCTEEQCNSFGKTFTRQDNYQRHVRMYHRELIHDILETQNSSGE